MLIKMSFLWTHGAGKAIAKDDEPENSIPCRLTAMVQSKQSFTSKESKTTKLKQGDISEK